MRYLSKLGIIVLFAAMLFSSCEKENLDQLTVNNPNYSPDTVDVNPFLKQINTSSGDTAYISCVGIPYPFELAQMSGNILPINEEEDLIAASQNPDSIVDFVYPLQVVVNNNSQVINNIEELVNCSSSKF